MTDANILQDAVDAAAVVVAQADAATLAAYLTSMQTTTWTLDDLMKTAGSLSDMLGDPKRKERAAGCFAILQRLIGEIHDMATEAAAATPAQVV